MEMEVETMNEENKEFISCICATIAGVILVAAMFLAMYFFSGLFDSIPK